MICWRDLFRAKIDRDSVAIRLSKRESERLKQLIGARIPPGTKCKVRYEGIWGFQPELVHQFP